MHKAWMLGIILFLPLTGCAPVALLSDNAPSTESPPSEEAVSAEDAERSDRSAAKESLRTAVANVVDGSIDFRYSLGDGSHTWERTSGTYVMEPEGWAATSRFVDASDNDTEYTMHVRSTDGRLWMQMEQWPEPDRGCWLALRRGMVPVGLLAMSPQQPAYITLLETVRPAIWAQGTSAGVMSVTMPLRGALRLLPARTVRAMGAKGVSMKGQRVNARADLADGRLTALHLTGGDLADALRRAKGKPLPLRARHIFATLRVSVEYPVVARSHLVRPPRPELVVSQEEAEAGRSCRDGEYF